MTINYVRRLTALARSKRENLHLGAGLAFVAGATNAGAFLAVHQYTSHMTGIVSEMADSLALGELGALFAGLAAVASFIAGAALTAVTVNFARRRGLESAFALPLVIEAVLLLTFGLLGARLNQLHTVFIPLTVALLCFTMGLQNAVITKISKAEVRTTHVTGIVTDIGIELGKLLYVNRSDAIEREPVQADRERLSTLCILLSAFFAGGVFGAFGFHTVGYSATIPLALLLLALGVIPVIDDMQRMRKTVAS